MRVPSYDDLTPSIPDVSIGEVLDSIARLVPSSADRGPGTRNRGPASACGPGSQGPTELYACLRSARLSDVLSGIAADFSPRCQRHGADALVVDVSGLGRLIGPPTAIARELARAAADRVCRDPRLSAACPVVPAAPAAGPRYVSRYGLRIEPHPSEHGRICGAADASRASGREGAAAASLAREQAVARILQRAGMRVAVAPSQTTALLLTLGGEDVSVVAAHPMGALAPRPVAALQQLIAGVHVAPVLGRRPRRARAEAPVRGGWPSPDACERAFDMLQRWGIATLGELAALPPADLSARAGRAGVLLQQLARGLDLQPLVPDLAVPRYLERLELEWPIDGLEPLSFVLARLLEPLAAALERADRGAAALRLDLRLVDRTTHARLLQLPVAMRDARVLRTLLLLDLESHPPPAAIDVVALELDPAPARVIQYSLLERALPPPETLATLAARLNALVGESRCGTPVVLDTHRPDAFEMRRLDAQALDGRPRPLAAADQMPCLRRFRPPVAVRVRVEHGRPAHLAIDRRGMPGGAVRQAAGPWRTSGDWWTRDEPWDRDEWDVELDDGVVCRMFQVRPGGGWFLEGVVD